MGYFNQLHAEGLRSVLSREDVLKGREDYQQCCRKDAKRLLQDFTLNQEIKSRLAFQRFDGKIASGIFRCPICGWDNKYPKNVLSHIIQEH